MAEATDLIQEQYKILPNLDEADVSHTDGASSLPMTQTQENNGGKTSVSQRKVRTEDFVQLLAEDAENRPEVMIPFTSEMVAHALELLDGVGLE